VFLRPILAAPAVSAMSLVTAECETGNSYGCSLLSAATRTGRVLAYRRSGGIAFIRWEKPWWGGQSTGRCLTMVLGGNAPR